jgi:alpha-tubulin suppressor-like RCC1 family protein
MALRADGTVWAWGRNSNGELGTGTTSSTPRLSPAPVPGITDAVWIAGGVGYALAVTADGKVWGWGLNTKGQLGLGDFNVHLSPVASTLITEVRQVDAGNEHAIALRSDGTVWCWGDRTYGSTNPGAGIQVGALGDGLKTGYTATPVQATPLPNAIFVVAGQGYSAAVTQDGFVYEWGKAYLQLSSSQQPASPMLRAGLSNINVMCASLDNQIAVDNEGRVWEWGSFSQGADGLGGGGIFTNNPVELVTAGGQPMASCDVGYNFSVIAGVDGAVYTYGSNRFGGLGIGRFLEKKLPVSIGALPPIAFVSMEPGKNPFQCGKWRALRYAFAETVSLPQHQLWHHGPALSGQDQVGGYYVQIQQDGRIFSRMYNDRGQLGLGHFNSPAAGYVSGLVNLRSLAVPWLADSSSTELRQGHAVAALSDGSVRAWGANFYGQVGDGTTNNRSSPTVIPGLSNITQVAVGCHHSLALDDSGHVFSWGHNHRGQLGDGTQVDKFTPQLIPGLGGIVQIAALMHFSFALQSDGSVWVWGDNNQSVWNPLPWQFYHLAC